MSTSNQAFNFCKKCGGFIKWMTSVQLCSYPAKYPGNCKDCGARANEFCFLVDGTEDPRD